MVYSKNSKNGSSKGHSFAYSYIMQSGHQRNFPFGSTCQSFLFIVTHMSYDQNCPFTKFPKSSFFGSAVNHSIFRNSVSCDQRVKTAKFHLLLA